MVSLIDAFYYFNSTRITGLISPEDLFKACELMNTLPLPYTMRKLRSGLYVIQNKSISDEEIAKQVQSYVEMVDAGVSSNELTALMDISLFMATEYVIIAETFGLICRDDSIEGSRYYRNKFLL